MRKEESFESFRTGMTAGHEVGQTEDLLYALGFAVGFLWGFLFAPRLERKRVETIPRAAGTASL